MCVYLFGMNEWLFVISNFNAMNISVFKAFIGAMMAAVDAVVKCQGQSVEL